MGSVSKKSVVPSQESKTFIWRTIVLKIELFLHPPSLFRLTVPRMNGHLYATIAFHIRFATSFLHAKFKTLISMMNLPAVYLCVQLH